MLTFRSLFRFHAGKVFLAAALAAVCFADAAKAVDLPVTSGNVLWLKADAGVTVNEYNRVTTWADQSGQGNDAVALDYGPRVLENGSASGELDMLDFILGGSAMSIAVPGPLPGDANRNGTVDAADSAVLSANWLTSEGAYWAQGDFNADGAVNDIDATLLATNWGKSTAASPLNPGTGGYTVFVAGSLWDDSSSRALLSKADGTSSKTPGYSVWANVTNNQSTTVRATGGPVPDPNDAEPYRASQSITMSTNSQVITMSMTGTNGGTQPGYVTGYRDGVGGWTNGGNGPTDNQYSLSVTSTSDLYIGGYGYVDPEDIIHATYEHRGTIGEILIYNRELSTVERTAVESYLINRWSGAAPPLPSFNSYYNFDEELTAGRTVYDQIDGVHGTMGRLRTGDNELIQNPTRVAGGVTGNALLFTRSAEDTGSEVHNFVTLGASAFYAPEDGAPITFSAWVNPVTISDATTAKDTDANRIMGLYRAGTNFGTDIAISLGQGDANGVGKLLTTFRVAGSYVNIDSTSTLSSDDTSGPNGDGWHHVAFTYDGSNLALYVDGAYAGGGAMAAYAAGSIDYNVIIGCNQQLAVGTTPRTDWFTSGFDGMIDDVQFYTSGLSAADIAWIVANPGQYFESAASAVPEPASVVLLFGGVLALALLRRRSC